MRPSTRIFERDSHARGSDGTAPDWFAVGLLRNARVARDPLRTHAARAVALDDQISANVGDPDAARAVFAILRFKWSHLMAT